MDVGWWHYPGSAVRHLGPDHLKEGSTINGHVKQLEEKDKVMDASPALKIVYFQHLSNVTKWNFTEGVTHPQVNKRNESSFNTSKGLIFAIGEREATPQQRTLKVLKGTAQLQHVPKRVYGQLL